MEGLQEVTNTLSNGTIRDPLQPPFPLDQGSQPRTKTPIAIISGTAKQHISIFYEHSKTFREPIHKAHCMAIFVIAQISCCQLSCNSVVNRWSRADRLSAIRLALELLLPVRVERVVFYWKPNKSTFRKVPRQQRLVTLNMEGVIEVTRDYFDATASNWNTSAHSVLWRVTLY